MKLPLPALVVLALSLPAGAQPAPRARRPRHARVAPPPRPPPTYVDMSDVYSSVVPRCGDPMPSTGPSTDAPDLPSRVDVAAAMRALHPAMRACGSGDAGVATVTVVFDPQGYVVTATAAPPLLGTAVGTCLARAAQAARLPPFRRGSFRVSYPFRLN